MDYESKIDLSIVIPAYNVEEYIEDTVYSVLNQKTQYKYEIIIINDGSTDNTLEIIKDKFEGNNNIIIISKTNKGLAHTRNVGIEHAQGKYIYFLDSDDMLKPNMIEELLTEAYEYNLDALMFSATSFYDDDYEGNWKPSSYLRKEYKNLTGNKLLENQQKDNNVIVSSVLYIIKKEILNKYELIFPEGVNNEDNYFTYYLFTICNKISTTTEIYYCRRVRNNSIMTNSDNKVLFENYSSILNLIITDKDNFPKLENKIANSYLYPLFYSVLVNYDKMNKTYKERYKNQLLKTKNIMKKNSISDYYKIYIKHCIKKIIKKD